MCVYIYICTYVCVCVYMAFFFFTLTQVLLQKHTLNSLESQYYLYVYIYIYMYIYYTYVCVYIWLSFPLPYAGAAAEAHTKHRGVPILPCSHWCRLATGHCFHQRAAARAYTYLFIYMPSFLFTLTQVLLQKYTLNIVES